MKSKIILAIVFVLLLFVVWRAVGIVFDCIVLAILLLVVDKVHDMYRHWRVNGKSHK